MRNEEQTIKMSNTITKESLIARLKDPHTIAVQYDEDFYCAIHYDDDEDPEEILIVNNERRKIVINTHWICSEIKLIDDYTLSFFIDRDDGIKGVSIRLLELTPIRK